MFENTRKTTPPDINNKINVRIILVLAISLLTISAFAFLFILSEFPANNKYNELSAMGQWLGALFSCWAFIGLIASQALQYGSLDFQAKSLVYQAEALRGEIEANSINNTANTLSAINSIADSARLALNRIAENLIFSDPMINVETLVQKISLIRTYDKETPFISFALQDEKTKLLILKSTKSGVSALAAKSYIDLYQKMSGHAKVICDHQKTVNIFEIIMENSPIKQLYLLLIAETSMAHVDA